jgi:hypothetical protein
MVFRLKESTANQAISLRDALRNGNELCDFPRAAASNWE